MALGAQLFLKLRPGALGRCSLFWFIGRGADPTPAGAGAHEFDWAADPAALMLGMQRFQGEPLTTDPLAGFDELKHADRPTLMPGSQGKPHSCGGLAFSVAGVHDQCWTQPLLARGELRVTHLDAGLVCFSSCFHGPDCAASRLGFRLVETFDQLSAGLPDASFLTDGLLTKRVLRAFALAVLAPRPGELLWDLGAGTGSIGLEWCRLDSSLRALAVERDVQRAQRIQSNAAKLGVAGQLTVRVEAIAAALGALPTPHAVFIGGGIRSDVVQRCWDALAVNGRLVAHSVTLESEAVLFAAHARFGGELTRVGVETVEPIGGLSGFTPARTVTAWSVIKADR